MVIVHIRDENGKIYMGARDREVSSWVGSGFDIFIISRRNSEMINHVSSTSQAG